MPLIDIHTHLSSEPFDTDRSEVLDRAWQVCSHLVDIGSGSSPDTFDRARRFAEENARAYFTAGIHPHDANTLGRDQKIQSQIIELLAHPKCVAVGECGLDYFYQHSEKDIQKEVFRWHIALAEKTNLPLMIHTRDAEADTIELLKDYQGQAIFHCFTGTQALADFGLKKGFFISFSGIATFKTAEALRQVFLKTPLENVLIETDSPYLAPIPMRGKRNETAFIEHTASFLAQLRGMSFQEFATATVQNSERVFPKLKSSTMA